MIDYCNDLLKKKWFCVALLLFTTAVIYSNTLYNGFVYDDRAIIVSNTWIRDLSHIREIFTLSYGSFLPNITSAYYRPLFYIVYIFEYSLFELNPWGYHLVNIILQGGVTIMLYMLARRLLDKSGRAPIYPFAAAFYFAVHPVHSEVVAWIAALAEMPFTFLLLLALYLYIADRPTRLSLSVSGVLFFLALLFKETAFVLLPLIFIYDLSVRRAEGGRMRWKSYLLYLVIAAAYYGMRTNAIKVAMPGINWFDLTGYQYLINAFTLVPIYFYKFLVPVNLNVYYYMEPIRAITEPRGFLSLGFVFILGYVMFRLYRYDTRVFFTSAWVGISILPTLYLPGLGKNFVADRYLYLPSIGFCLFFAIAAQRTFERYLPGPGGALKTSFIFILAALSILMGAMTVSRNAVWRDDLTLWSDSVRKSPMAAMPHYNLGIEYAEREMVNRAIDEFRRAAKLDPGYDDAFYNLGVMYEQKGLIKEAVAKYREVIRINPASADAHLNIGRLYMNEGLMGEAELEFQEALRIDKDLHAARAYLEKVSGEKR